MACNVFVREDVVGGCVELLDPMALFELTDRADVAPLAQELRVYLDRVLAAPSEKGDRNLSVSKRHTR